MQLLVQSVLCLEGKSLYSVIKFIPCVFSLFFLFVLSFYQHSCNNSSGEMEQMYSTHMYERMNEYDYHVLDPLKDIVLCFLCVCLCVCMFYFCIFLRCL